MKYYLVPESGTGKLVKVGASLRPSNAVVEVPLELAGEDAEALKVVNGQCVLDPVAKEAVRKQREDAKAKRDADEQAKRERKGSYKARLEKAKTIADLRELLLERLEDNE